MKTSITFIVALCAIASGFGRPSEEHMYVMMEDKNGIVRQFDLLEKEVTRKAVNPQSDISLLLYTKNNPNSAQQIQIETNALPSNFDVSKKTRFIIHGWQSSAEKMDEFRSAYLAESESINVVLVDWSGPAGGLYNSAKESTKEVGAYVAKAIQFMISKGNNINNIQVAGHSLGAHITGIVGHALNGALTMITGMDPAAPLYGSEDLATRLDSTDAKFVQVIHTCAGVLGWSDPMGHADFYPNGGHMIQPGCGLDIGSACSHGRSHHYFAESITSSTGFVGHLCTSYDDYEDNKCSSTGTALMGEHISTGASGQYYLKTGSSSPFALGA